MPPEFWTLCWAFLGAGAGSFASEWVAAHVRAAQGAEKNRDDDLIDLLENLNSLRTIAEAYWLKSAVELGEQEVPMRAQINAHLHHINLIVSDMFTGDIKRKCDIAYTPLMRATAGGAFGDDDREADANRLVVIHQASLSFRRTAIKCRRGLKRTAMA